MKHKPRILICGILPPPNFGHSMLYKMLMSTPFPKEFSVTFLNMTFWSYQKHKRVTVDKLLKMVKYYVQYVFLILTKRPDYIFYNMSFEKMPFLKDFLFCMTGRALGCRIILHDLGQYLREMEALCPPLQKKLLHFFMKHLTASIVMGERTRHVYEGFMPLDRVYAAPGAVADTKDMVIGPDVKKERAADIVQVLYFSFVTPTKGCWTALKAVPLVLKECPEARFIFGGPIQSPALEEEIRQYLRDNNLGGHVELLGYIGHEETRTAYFRDADIYMFPTHRDVFGLVLLHAMAEGKAIVASREGNVPEILDEGTCGLLFEKKNSRELAEKIISLAKKRALRERLGQAARTRYEKMYTIEAYGRHMIDVMRTIIRETKDEK